MYERSQTESRKLLGRLREALAEDSAGQARLDKITQLIATSMGTEVCSIYLFRDEETLELCATEGLNAEAVHQTRMRLGEGLVGRVAKTSQIMATADAPSAKGFRYMPETGEELYSSFCGVPIQRLGEKLGVLVVQSKDARVYSADETYALEVVAMVLAEMTELGAFVGEGAALSARHQQSVMFKGGSAQEGAAEGNVWLHEPRVVVSNPIADDPETETARLTEAVEQLRATRGSVGFQIKAHGFGKTCRHCRRANRMRGVSVAVIYAALCRIGVFEYIRDLFIEQRRAHWEIARCDALGSTHHIRLHAEVTRARPAASTPKTCDHLVRDHQDAMAIAHVAHEAHETGVRNDNAARTLDRLHDEGGDCVRALELDLVLEGGSDVLCQLRRVRLIVRIAIGVGAGQVETTCKKRLVSSAETVVAIH